MISKVTESNKGLIDSRIAEINAALAAKGSSTVIDSFESYYANIVEIAALSTNFHNAPYKYFLMPLDEPLFEIDANKRSIAVPAQFSKNGVGVYGDHMAEVLYFSIDRYFDYQDLFNVDEIIINWQFRPSNASRNATLETHTSIALAPDDTFIPGKVVFGWVITNEMTPSKGNLTFSVSFLKRTGDTYEYVLNTQTASVNISDSLVLEDPSVLDNMARPVFERLMNSRYTIDSITPLVDPIFRTGIDMKGLNPIANFDMDENGIEDEKLLLQVIGYSSDDGNIKYSWHGTTTSGESKNRDPEDVTVPDDCVPTTETYPNYNTNIKYYIIQDNELKELPIMDGDTVVLSVEDALDPDRHYKVVELGSSLAVSEAGQYIVTMQSVKEVTQYKEASGVSASNFSEDVYYIKQDENYVQADSFVEGAQYYTKQIVNMKSGNVQSQTCTVPRAAIPSVTLKVAGVTPKDGNYSIVDEEIAGQYIFVDESSSPSVKAIVTKDDSNVMARSNMASISLSVSKLVEAPNDVNKEVSQANQDNIEVVQNGNNAIVLGDFSELNSFASTNPHQGEAKWIGLDIGVNVNDISELTWNGQHLTADDVAESASVGLSEGHIIFWAKAEQLPRVIRIGRDGYDEVELKVSFAEKADYVPADGDTQDSQKVLDNARKGIFKESSLGRIAFALVEEGSEPDFSGKELVRYDSEPEFTVESEDSIEGTYCVYVLNERNHTQSISEPSNVIKVSKIAPYVNGINVEAVYNGNRISLIENNVETGEEISMRDNNYVCDFYVTLNNNINENVELTLEAIEVRKVNDEIQYLDDTTDVPNIYSIDENGHFQTVSDPGRFVIRATTIYNGTKRVTETDTFLVTDDQN